MDHPITGSLILMKVESISLRKSKYVVVARPKSATISADKMNVVYRGL
jgi:hypothetical protein